MTDPKTILQRLQTSLNILQEREAKYGLDVPVALTHEIEDHQTAITLTEELIAGHLTETAWREQLRPLLVEIEERKATKAVSTLNIGGVSFSSISGSTITVGDITVNQAVEEPPFWRRLSRVQLVLTIVLGLIATGAAVLAVPGVSNVVYDLFKPLAFPPAGEDETLIVLAAFDVAEGMIDNRPHELIEEVFEEKVDAAGLENVRIEDEPTVLQADAREEAEALGRQYQASMIIWGEERGVRIKVNFLNLRDVDYPAGDPDPLEETERVYNTSHPEAYNQFISRDLPNQLSFFAFYAIGRNYYLQKNWDEAITAIEEAIEAIIDPTKIDGLSEAYFRLGWLYQVPNKNPDKAVEYYTIAIDLDPDSVGAYNNRGNAYSDLGQYQQAITDYTKAIDVDPDYTFAYNNRGNAYSNLDQHEKAISDLNYAIDLDPEFAFAYNNRGIAYSDLGQHQRAIADFGHAIEFDPDFAFPYNNRGIAYSDLGQHQQAIADFTKAIELDPSYSVAYNGRGNSYADLGQYQQAIADFTKAIEFDPDFAFPYSNRGITYSDLGQHQQALADFNQAISLDPDFAFAYNGRGNTYSDLGQYQRAIADFNQAIDLDPEFAFAYNNRGNAYNGLGQYRQAIADFDKAIELDPEYAFAYNNRGIAYDELGQYEQAIKDYTKDLELNSEDALAYYNRGIAYAKMGEADQAMTDLEQGKKLAGDTNYPDWVRTELEGLDIPLE